MTFLWSGTLLSSVFGELTMMSSLTVFSKLWKKWRRRVFFCMEMVTIKCRVNLYTLSNWIQNPIIFLNRTRLIIRLDFVVGTGLWFCCSLGGCCSVDGGFGSLSSSVSPKGLSFLAAWVFSCGVPLAYLVVVLFMLVVWVLLCFFLLFWLYFYTYCAKGRLFLYFGYSHLLLYYILFFHFWKKYEILKCGRISTFSLPIQDEFYSCLHKATTIYIKVKVKTQRNGEGALNQNPRKLA